MIFGKCKYHIATGIIIVAILFGGNSILQSADRCPVNMVFVPGGSYITGHTEKEIIYLMSLCQETIGNCSELWFKNEMPQRPEFVKSFCMDKYEYPNKKGEFPEKGMAWNIAQQTCKSKGKVLCTTSQWEKACSAGDMANTWSYGWVYTPGTCNEETRSVAKSGQFGKCRTESGINDLTGNLAEWVDGEIRDPLDFVNEPSKIIKGGSFRGRPIFSRCTAVSNIMPTETSREVGFRCCM